MPRPVMPRWFSAPSTAMAPKRPPMMSFTLVPARAIAVDRLDLDHLGAHVGQHHAAGRAHDHVREFDDAQAFERLGKGSAARHAATFIIFGKPARQSVPCKVSPSSHCLSFAR